MNPAVEDEEDGWFGEGSAFDSGEDLAAALMELAGVPTGITFVEQESPATQLEEAGRPRDLTFEMLRPSHHTADTVAASSVGRWSSVNKPLTWTVRTPGSADVPARSPGKSGWSIRSSVAMLQRTEEMLLTLREEAVAATLIAASQAIRTSK